MKADVQQSVVRDLWALRLQTLRNRVPHGLDPEAETHSSQVFSSQSESETPTESQSTRSRRSSAKDTQSRSLPPNLLETLSFCYIGALLLRVPLTVADVQKWTNEGDLLYYRAPREVPLGMRERLPALYQELLEPQDFLPPQKLHENIMEMLATLDVEFGMATPPINLSLVLYRWTESLALPLEVFATTKRLARILNVDGRFDTVSSSAVLRYPEARLMGLLVIATKLLLPFDKVERRRKADADLPTLSMDWNEWARIHHEKEEATKDPARLGFEKAFNFVESGCLEATNDTLDSYLDWYGDNVASEDVRDRGHAARDAEFRRALFRIYPTYTKASKGKEKTRPTTTIDDDSQTEERLRWVQATLLPSMIVGGKQSDQNMAQPGSFYPRFRRAEELTGPVKIFFDKAAELAGLSIDGMIQAVFLTERKLQRHEEGLRKTNTNR